MPNPLHSSSYEAFRALLVEAREKAQMTQVEVAQRLEKPQSFVSKYERGERRLDFTEFLELASILSIDPIDFIKRYQLAITNKSNNKG
jgi:transcriptional regulator with XRE-family HTH domain